MKEIKRECVSCGEMFYPREYYKGRIKCSHCVTKQCASYKKNKRDYYRRHQAEIDSEGLKIVGLNGMDEIYC